MFSNEILGVISDDVVERKAVKKRIAVLTMCLVIWVVSVNTLSSIDVFFKLVGIDYSDIGVKILLNAGIFTLYNVVMSFEISRYVSLNSSIKTDIIVYFCQGDSLDILQIYGFNREEEGLIERLVGAMDKGVIESKNLSKND